MEARPAPPPLRKGSLQWWLCGGFIKEGGLFEPSGAPNYLQAAFSNLAELCMTFLTSVRGAPDAAKWGAFLLSLGAGYGLTMAEGKKGYEAALGKEGYQWYRAEQEHLRANSAHGFWNNIFSGNGFLERGGGALVGAAFANSCRQMIAAVGTHWQGKNAQKIRKWSEWTSQGFNVLYRWIMTDMGRNACNGIQAAKTGAQLGETLPQDASTWTLPVMPMPQTAS